VKDVACIVRCWIVMPMGLLSQVCALGAKRRWPYVVKMATTNTVTVFSLDATEAFRLGITDGFPRTR
jgi:hypothetical protein